MSTETADVLAEAANVIRRNGWTDCGDYFDNSGVTGVPGSSCPVCTLGAIGIAAGLEPQAWARSSDAVAAADALRRYLGRALDEEGHETVIHQLMAAVGVWNDCTANSAEEVIAALEGAAAAERECPA